MLKQVKISALLLSFTFLSFTYGQWEDESIKGAQRIGEVYNYIDQMYLDSVNYDKITEAAIISMLEELDPHSTYIPAKDVQNANQRIDGSFVGIGIRFQILKDTLLVVNCVYGGPSAKVGIRAGDRIIKIEDENIAGIGLRNQGVRDRLLGEKDTRVKITVVRRKSKAPIDFTITRDKIPLHSVVSHYMVDQKVGYIKLTNFSRTTSEEVKKTIKDLKKQGMQDLIFDLQGNTGGLLYAAKYVADEFLKKGQLIVYQEGRSQPRQVLNAENKGEFEDGRLIVLIDQGSASASEILAGAIQDWDRGLVVGRRSFGKGLVQRPIELSDGAQLRLTIARYFTPSGRFIQKPYDDLDAYKNDYMERFQSGEFSSKDSIKIDDSLKFETKINKRTVYGGGGIIPDEFVGLDTLEYSTYYRKLSYAGMFNSFTVEYATKNREKILSEFKEFKDFKKDFSADEKLMKEFIDFAEKEDTSLVFMDEDYRISKDLMQKRIKALIAQNIWDYSSYYEIMNVKNEVFMRAYEILSRNEYDLFNLAAHN
jgi:carboxyl-terminal processing protease